MSLVLIDVQMPDMDGFAVVDSIRKDAELARATMLMLTSTGHLGDQARCRELGIASLMKPIDPSKVRDMLAAALADPSLVDEPHALVTSQAVPDVQRTLHVLLAEDNPVNQLVASRLLEKRGHTSSSLPAAGRCSRLWKWILATTSIWY